MTPRYCSPNFCGLPIIWSKFYEGRKLKSIFTEYDFYRHGENQTVRLYFTEKNQGME
jgi:hypothetical protein